MIRCRCPGLTSSNPDDFVYASTHVSRWRKRYHELLSYWDDETQSVETWCPNTLREFTRPDVQRIENITLYAAPPTALGLKLCRKCERTRNGWPLDHRCPHCRRHNLFPDGVAPNPITCVHCGKQFERIDWSREPTYHKSSKNRA